LIYYDLHIHSCLSPCADDDMTPNNIVNMALLKGLGMISVTDHNSLLNQKAIKKVATKNNLKYIYGVEVQTMEDVHSLVYLKTDEQVDEMEKYLDLHLMKIDNKPDYFGNQLIMDEEDNVLGQKKELLLSSIDESIEQLCDFVHSIGGLFIPAHILDRKNSITEQLGFIPLDLKYDGLEINSKDDFEIKKLDYPNCKLFISDSDAHQLIDINEQEMFLVDKEAKVFL